MGDIFYLRFIPWYWALQIKSALPLHPIEEVGIPDFLGSFKDLNSRKNTVLDHISILFLIKFVQIPSFCHNLHDFQKDFTKSSGFPHIDKTLQSGFPDKFCNNFDILYIGEHFKLE